MLTCEWHNWKLDPTAGGCLFGGEPVRRYLTLVENGRVKLDRTLDHTKEATRLEAGLRAALVDDDASRALREGLRLGEHRRGAPALEPLGAAFAVLAEDGAAAGRIWLRPWARHARGHAGLGGTWVAVGGGGLCPGGDVCRRAFATPRPPQGSQRGAGRSGADAISPTRCAPSVGSRRRPSRDE